MNRRRADWVLRSRTPLAFPFLIHQALESVKTAECLRCRLNPAREPETDDGSNRRLFYKFEADSDSASGDQIVAECTNRAISARALFGSFIPICLGELSAERFAIYSPIIIIIMA